MTLTAGAVWAVEPTTRTPLPEPSRKVIDINETDLLGIGGEEVRPPGYSVTWYPSRHVSGSHAREDLELVRQSLFAVVPLSMSESEVLAFSTGAEYSSFSSNATLPDSGRPFPDDLWSIQPGLSYLRKANGRLYGANVIIGSPSDKPYHSLDELDPILFGFMQTPARNERDAWRFLLVYAPASSVGFPIPGLAYLWNPSDTFHASLGMFPAVLWQPAPKLTVNVSYLPPAASTARVTYQLLDTLALYGGFESLQRSYLLAGREDNDDRFLGLEERLVAGLRWDMGSFLVGEVSGGYALHRAYAVGESWFNHIEDEVDIDPGPFASASLRLRF